MAYGMSNQTLSVAPSNMRKKLGYSYADEIRSRYGTATEAVAAKRGRELEDRIRTEDIAMQNQELKLQEDSIKSQAEQAQTQTLISAGALGIAAYPKIATAATNLYGAATAASTGSTAAAEMVLADSAAAGMGAGGASGASSVATGVGSGSSAAITAAPSTGIAGVAAGAGAAIAAQQLYDSAPISGKIKDTYKVDLTPDSVGEMIMGPIPGTSDVADWVDTQVNSAGDAIADAVGTHFCTAIDKEIGVDKRDMVLLRRFKEWCLENHPDITWHYLKYGDKSVQKLQDQSKDKAQDLQSLKDVVVTKVVSLLKENKIDDAFKIYRDKYLEVLEQYTPEYLEQ